MDSMAEKRDATRGSRILGLLGAGFLVLGCLVVGFAIPIGAIYIYLWASSPSFDDREFDSAAWFARSDSARVEMAHDLRDRLLVQRPTYGDVVRLLGEPRWPIRKPPRRIEYDLGVRDQAVHSLRVHFGEDGRVEQVWIVSRD